MLQEPCYKSHLGHTIALGWSRRPGNQRLAAACLCVECCSTRLPVTSSTKHLFCSCFLRLASRTPSCSSRSRPGHTFCYASIWRSQHLCHSGSRPQPLRGCLYREKTWKNGSHSSPVRFASNMSWHSFCQKMSQRDTRKLLARWPGRSGLPVMVFGRWKTPIHIRNHLPMNKPILLFGKAASHRENMQLALTGMSDRTQEGSQMMGYVSTTRSARRR